MMAIFLIQYPARILIAKPVSTFAEYALAIGAGCRVSKRLSRGRWRRPRR